MPTKVHVVETMIFPVVIYGCEKHPWQIDGETMKKMRDFILGGSKITAGGDCSHEIGRKAMTNLDSILKSRDMTLPTKVPIVKAMVFPVVIYGCESWTIRKPDC